jgi:hypothetical protein
MSRTEKVKNHFRTNKKTYIACGVTAVVAAGVTYYFVGKSATTKTIEAAVPELVQNISQTASQIGNYRPTINNTFINFVERSTPSKLVGLLSSDGESVKQAFSSINEAGIFPT